MSDELSPSSSLFEELESRRKSLRVESIFTVFTEPDRKLFEIKKQNVEACSRLALTLKKLKILDKNKI